jgi:hypothetical protein
MKKQARRTSDAIKIRAFGWQLGKAHREGRKGIARQQAGEMLE